MLEDQRSMIATRIEDLKLKRRQIDDDMELETNKLRKVSTLLDNEYLKLLTNCLCFQINLKSLRMIFFQKLPHN